MGVHSRAFRDVYRSETRAVLSILILGLALAVFLVLSQAAVGIEFGAARIAASVGNLVEVRAAGATGMGIGVEALPASFFERAKDAPAVARVEPYLYQRVIDPSQRASISIVVGVRPGDTLRVASHGEVGDPTIVAGRNLRPEDAGQPAAVIGQVFAQQYGLGVGSSFTIRPGLVARQDRPDPNVEIQPLGIEVVGIFSSAFVFGDNQVFVPLDVAQRAFAQEGKITHVFVTAASVDKVGDVERGLQRAFGERADIISGQETARSQSELLRAIAGNSRLGATVALVVGALVVLLTMALATRERTREVGTLKAIGASDAQVAAQFAAEALFLAAFGAIVGLLIAGLGGSALGEVLLQALGAPPTVTAFHAGETPLQTIGLRFGVSGGVLLAAVVTVVILGILGSLYPVAQALRTRPAEALRYEG